MSDRESTRQGEIAEQVGRSADDERGRRQWRRLIVAVVATGVIVSVLVVTRTVLETLISAGLYAAGVRLYRSLKTDYVLDDAGEARGTRRVFVVALAMIGIILWIRLVPDGFFEVVLIATVLLVGHRLYRWTRSVYVDEGGETVTVDERETVDDASTEEWQDLVVHAVEERTTHTRLVLRNTTDEEWNLSHAVIVDDNGAEFVVRDGVTIPPTDETSIPVEKDIELVEGQPVTLRLESGKQYDVQWANSSGTESGPSD